MIKPVCSSLIPRAMQAAVSWYGNEATNLSQTGSTSVNGSVKEPRLVLVQFLVGMDLAHCSPYLNICIVSLGLQPLLMDLGADENT